MDSKMIATTKICSQNDLHLFRWNTQLLSSPYRPVDLASSPVTTNKRIRIMSIVSHTNLRSGEIDGSHDANRAFGEDSSLIVGRPKRSCCSNFWFTVPDGYYALVTSHGIQVDFEDSEGKRSCVWPSGLHLGPPWRKVSHLITKQTVLMSMSIENCTTKDSIPISVNVSTSFRIMGDADKNEDPKSLYTFVHHLTPQGLEQQLLSTQTDLVCNLIGNLDHFEVFDIFKNGAGKSAFNTVIERNSDPNFDEASTPMARLKGIEEEYDIDDQTCGLLEQEEKVDIDTNNALSLTRYTNQRSYSSQEAKASIKQRLNEKFNAFGVEIIDVMLHNVVVSEESKSKLIEETKIVASAKEEQMKKLSELLKFIQEEETIKLEQSIEEEKTTLLKDGEYDELVESMELLFQNAKSQDLVEKIQVQTQSDVKLIDIENEYTVQKLMDAAKLDARKIVEEAKAESAIANEEANGEANIIEALADMESANFEANGQKALVQAEVIATPMMRKIHEYKSKMLKIKVHESLAENNRLVITGTSGGSTANQILMADAALLDVAQNSIDDPTRNKIIEELKQLQQSNRGHS